MKRKIVPTILVALMSVALWLALAGPSHGTLQESMAMSQVVSDLEPVKSDWIAKRNVVLALTILVGVLGVVTGSLQTLKKKWTPAAVVILGATISIVTIVNNTLFPADHRGYQKAAAKASSLIAKINTEIMELEFLRTAADSAVAREKIRELVKEFYSLEEEVLFAGANLDAGRSFVRPAYAAVAGQEPDEPLWVSQPPDDTRHLYFVGVGKDPDLRQAREQSYQDALAAATDHWVTTLAPAARESEVGFDVAAISRYLASAGEVAETFFRAEGGGSVFTYYTLMRVNKRFLEVDLKILAITSKTAIPKEIASAVIQSQRSAEEYVSRRTQIRAGAVSLARDSLGLDDAALRRYREGRRQRLAGDFEGGVRLLTEVTEQYPNFYLAWLDLGLAYDGLGDSPQASLSLERAVRLDSIYAIGDASVYNSYGFILYKQHRYEEAEVQLKKALQLDPTHPTAGNTLRVVLRRRGQP